MLFDKELFNKMLDCIEQNYREYLIGTIDLQNYDYENDPDALEDTIDVLRVIKKLRKIDYDTYNDETEANNYGN